MDLNLDTDGVMLLPMPLVVRIGQLWGTWLAYMTVASRERAVPLCTQCSCASNLVVPF